MASSEPPPAVTNGLVVPIVIWGKKPPDNRMTAVRYLSDRTTIVTGDLSGHVITWKCDEESLTPCQLMIGHDAPITAISPTNHQPSSTRFITASSDGQLCLWDLQDGRCVDSVSSLYIHRYMQPYTYKSSRHTRSTRLFCIGDYSDIVVLDPQDLTVVFQLSSRVEPDWICSYEIVQRTNKSEQCIGISMAGMIKVWSLMELEKKDLATPLYEDESKRLELRDVKSISFNSANERLLLIVCSTTWQLIDLDDLSVIIIHNCSGRAVNGKILDVDKIAVAFADHTLRVYQLPLEKLEGAQVRQRFGETPKNYLGISDPFEFALWEGSRSNVCSWLNDVTFTFAPQRSDHSLFQAAQATQSGQLLIWRIPRFGEEVYEKFSSPAQFPLKYRGSFEEALSSMWANPTEKESISMGVMDFGGITCSLFVSSQGKLIMGRSDGLIVMTNACESLGRQLLNVNLEKPSLRYLNGHKGAVSNLLYPHEHHPRFDPELLVSGAEDFAVIVWNINTVEKLHCFVVHGGPILRFLVPPPNTTKQVNKCICAIAADHSVSLLNIRDMKCVLLASRHPYPVNLIKWRPLDDYMLVRLDDGSVFVWEMDIAALDRVVFGVIAEEFLSACDEQIGKEEGTDQTVAPQAIVLMRTLRYRGMDMMRGRLGTPDPNAQSDSPSPSPEMNTVQLSPPMSITPLPGSDRGAHLVQIDVGSLIGGIVHLDSAEEAVYNERRISQAAPKQDSEENTPTVELSRRLAWQFESNLYLDIARLLLSLLHGWNLDNDLDAVCIKKLGLNKPKGQLYFGNVSRQGQLSVALPQKNEQSFDRFSTQVRWQASHSLTTTHLLAIIATANTLMGMKNAATQVENTRKGTFAPQTQSVKKLTPEGVISERQQLKQGWSLLAALHCVLLPDHVRPRSSYAAPRIELLARRWQDSCVEIREAAQALLIRELSRLGSAGRRRLIESWTPFLPPLLDPALSIFGARLQSSVPTLPPSAPPIPPRQKNSPPPLAPVPEPSIGEDGESGVQQVRRNQATAIILLGVVGAEFGDEFRAELMRATALSLLELLVAAPSPLLPVHSPLRRAAIDLLGRGFVHWEPHLEISKVVLGLLDLAANTDKQPPPPIVGAPLSPIADACRTARHALTLIATARPTALLSALSMEVARYNSAAQHQTIQHTVVSPLLKSRSEVLRIIEELSEKRYAEVVEMMLPVGDILVHCLDTSLLKQKTLSEIFPPITKFFMVAYCSSTRRIAFGGKNGTCVVHELRAAKAHNLQAHQGPVAAVAFSEDGKYLATYGEQDSKINFWQTSQTFLGMGQNQMKLVKSQPAPSLAAFGPNGTISTYRPKLVWINLKSLTLMMPEGREQRFTV
uniref:WD_REPEATS_REGION domain-containing protein n=1 Tax=Haemonchus contortus TaxID=6289 RepID=A0A7I4YHT4_HAECO|nr:WD40 repeat domain containing protein [Haemonchus contortus]